MANPFVNSAINPLQFFAPDVAADATQLARQQAMVDALRQRATAEDPTQVVSGIALKNSQLGRIASSLLADYKQRGIDQKQVEMAKRYAEALGGATTGTGGVVDPETLRQAAILDAVSPGAGKSLIQSRIDQSKPVDVVRTAQQLFPNDPVAQQQYLQGYARKQTELTRTPGSYVVGMDGEMVETPMSAADKRRLELQERSTAAQESRAQTAAREAQQATGSGGGFAGTSMEAQASNRYRNLLIKQQRGEPLTPEEQVDFGLAKGFLERPQFFGNLDTGVMAVDKRFLPTLPATTPAPSQAGAPAPMPAVTPAQAAAPVTPAAAPAVPPTIGAPREVVAPKPRTKQQILDKAQAEAEIALPDIEAEVTKAISEIETLLKNPNLGSFVGNPSGLITSRIPGQPAADIAAALKQIEGGAFLTAIQKLRGSGAVSESEGKSATAAQTSMSSAQSVPAFKKAGADYIKILQDGLARAKQKAGVEQKAPAAPSTSSGRLTLEEQAERAELLQKLEQMRGQQ